jgi:integrase
MIAARILEAHERGRWDLLEALRAHRLHPLAFHAASRGHLPPTAVETALRENWWRAAGGANATASAAVPAAREAPRAPQLTPAEFALVLAQVPPVLRPAYVTLVATGMRIREYLRLEPTDLRPDLPGLHIPGTKTARAATTLPVDPRLWPWI